LPTEEFHWLNNDAQTPKAAVVPLRVAEHPATLQGLVFFADDTEVFLERIAPMAALGALVPQVVRFVVDEPSRLVVELQLLSALVSAVPCFVLHRPRNVQHLPSCALALATLFPERSPGRAGAPP